MAKKPRKHGGARKGAGRKRDKLPDEVLAALGRPPMTSPAELRIWNAKLLAQVQWLAVNGKIPSDLAASIRANAGSIVRALPTEFAGPNHTPHDGDGDEVESDDAGPELESEDDDGGLRVG